MQMISVCIIAKNEETNIERCLESLSKCGFEIIVVDTGSTDNTKAVAKKYTDKVFDFIWCNDFAVTKNFAISKAQYEYVMVIDSDEFINDIDIQKLYRDIELNPDRVGRIYRRNIFEKTDPQKENLEWINRIFNKKIFHYEGRIHEQVVRLDGKPYETYLAPVTILHTGYDLSENKKKQKAHRNIILLKEELDRLTHMFIENNYARTGENLWDENAVHQPAYIMLDHIIQREDSISHILQGDEHIPYILYQLGKGYYMAGDYKEACGYFYCALEFDLNPKLEYVIDAVETYGYALINSGNAAEAMLLESVYNEFGSTADFQFLMGLIYMNNERFDDAVEEFLKAVKHKTCRNLGCNSYLAYYNIGVIYECIGEKNKAILYYKKCEQYKQARNRLALLQAEK